MGSGIMCNASISIVKTEEGWHGCMVIDLALFGKEMTKYLLLYHISHIHESFNPK